MNSCVCGHAPEEHPNGGECEGTIKTVVADGAHPRGEEVEINCRCVAYEEEESEDE